MSNLWICADAGLVLRLLVDPEDEMVRNLWDQWDAERQRIAAPSLLYYEVTNVLHRYRRAGLMGEAAIRMALTAAQALPITLYDEPTLHARALEIAGHFSLPAAYDAHYLALAEFLDGEFWTLDQRLVNVVQGELSWVHVARRLP